MPEDLKLSQIGSSQLPPPFRGLHSPGVRKLSNYLCLLFPEIVYWSAHAHCWTGNATKDGQTYALWSKINVKDQLSPVVY